MMYALMRNITDERLSRIAVSVEKGRAALNGDMLRLSGLLQSVVPVYTGIYICSILCFMMIKAQMHSLKTHMRVYFGRNDVHGLFVNLFRPFH